MPIGLSSDELLGVVFGSYQYRIQNLDGQLAAARVGESPELSKMLETLRPLFPSIQPQEFLYLIEFLQAMLDAIVANNVVLARAVPHVEHSP